MTNQQAVIAGLVAALVVAAAVAGRLWARARALAGEVHAEQVLRVRAEGRVLAAEGLCARAVAERDEWRSACGAAEAEAATRKKADRATIDRWADEAAVLGSSVEAVLDGAPVPDDLSGRALTIVARLIAFADGARALRDEVLDARAVESALRAELSDALLARARVAAGWDRLAQDRVADRADALAARALALEGAELARSAADRLDPRFSRLRGRLTGWADAVADAPAPGPLEVALSDGSVASSGSGVPMVEVDGPILGGGSGG